MSHLSEATRRSNRDALLAWNRAVYEFDMAIMRRNNTNPDYRRAMLDCKHVGFASPFIVAQGGTA